MIEVTDDLIRATVSPNAYAAGHAYMKDGRVRAIGLEPTTGQIRAVVKGSGNSRYTLTVSMREKGGRVVLRGDCSCPVGLNCKHVAAALLTKIQQDAARRGRQPAAVKTAAPVKPSRYQMAGTQPAPAAALPTDLTAWLRELAASVTADSEEYPANVTKRIFYMLGQSTHPGRMAPALSILIALGDLKRDGTISARFTTPDSGQVLRMQPAPKYIRPSDRAILRNLAGYMLDETRCDAASVVREILATGRGRLGAFPGRVARLGAARGATLHWTMDNQGNQRPALQVTGGATPFLLPSPWYFDTANGEVGTVEIGVQPTMLRRLLNAPPVQPDQTEAVRNALMESLPATGLPALQDIPHGGKIGGKPVPLLQLQSLDLAYHSAADQFAGASAALSFRYGSIMVRAETPPGPQERMIDGVRYTLKRDERAEKRANVHLGNLGLKRLRHAMRWGAPPLLQDRFVMASEEPENDWIGFMLDAVPELRGMGWEVEIADDFPHDLITADGPMQAELRESSGIDWFDLDLGVMVGDERIDLVPPLIKILSGPNAAAIMQNLAEPGEGGQKMVLTLKDGRRLALDVSALRPVLVTLFELFGGGGITGEGERFRVTRQGAAGMAALEKAGLDANMVWRGGDALRSLGKLLNERGGINHVPVPKWFAADLRAYQQQGVDWLQFLREAGLAGVLADDMGLGKTVQALAHLCVEKQAGRLTKPALVICPTSVVGNWAREASRFAPSLRVLTLQGADRKSRFDDIGKHHLVISTYPLLSRDEEILVGQEWHTLILDEAQTVKNPAATMAQAVRRLRAGQRICLTGTPMENHLGELWALFDFMMPGFLGSARDFGSRFRNPIEKGGDTERHAALAKRVSPFLLRRTKAEVVTELPPRTDIIETIQMEPPQRAVYDGIRLSMHTRVQEAIAQHGLAKSGIVILDALLKLRQACCDPRLLKIGGAATQRAGSAKLERLLELIETLRDEGRSILLFSQFTSMLALIEAELRKRGVDYALLTGETTDRTKPVDDFQAGRVKLFLISLKAGGVGLNLTAADTVIHYDPWWNPAVENQATDRAHRIGQTKSVFVHRLITEDSIEEKMEGLKARKAALAEGILGGAGAAALKMTEADVEMLFS